MKKGREEKTKFSKILPNNQIITACHIKLQVQEMTMNKKLTMTGLYWRFFSILINLQMFSSEFCQIFKNTFFAET